MTEPQSQSSDSDRLAATLAQLEAEREKRLPLAHGRLASARY